MVGKFCSVLSVQTKCTLKPDINEKNFFFLGGDALVGLKVLLASSTLL